MNKVTATLIRQNDVQDIFHVIGYGCYSQINEYVYRPKGLYTISDIAIEYLN